MAYDYEPPRNEVWGFLIFTLVAGVIALTVTNRNRISSLSWEIFTAISMGLTAYICPMIICIRVVESHDPGSSPAAATLLKAEASSAGALAGFSLILATIRYSPNALKEIPFGNLRHKDLQ